MVVDNGGIKRILLARRDRAAARARDHDEATAGPSGTRPAGGR